MTGDIETLKSRLAGDLEQEKRKLDEQSRRQARVYDRKVAFYETFAVEYGRVLAELWALQQDFTASLNTVNPELGAKVRGLFVSRAHAMLMQAEEKLAPDAVYIDVFLQKRIAALFADLSRFIGEGARDRDRLDALTLEDGMINAELRSELFGQSIEPRFAR